MRSERQQPTDPTARASERRPVVRRWRPPPFPSFPPPPPWHRRGEQALLSLLPPRGWSTGWSASILRVHTHLLGSTRAPSRSWVETWRRLSCARRRRPLVSSGGSVACRLEGCASVRLDSTASLLSLDVPCACVWWKERAIEALERERAWERERERGETAPAHYEPASRPPHPSLSRRRTC